MAKVTRTYHISNKLKKAVTNKVKLIGLSFSIGCEKIINHYICKESEKGDIIDLLVSPLPEDFRDDTKVSFSIRIDEDLSNTFTDFCNKISMKPSFLIEKLLANFQNEAEEEQAKILFAAYVKS